MKFSNFNVWTRRNGGVILWNSLTGALATFDDQYIERVVDALQQSCPSLMPLEFSEALVDDGYVVDDGCDELDKIRNMVVARQKCNDEYFLSILLNLACNFDCFYCFEKHTGEVLEEEVARRLELMVERVVGQARKIAVDWYGGEPLLSFDVLRRLSDRFASLCGSSGVYYEMSVTTNGYLLTADVIAYLKSAPTTHLQISIDGPPETHNQSRPLKGGQPTFNVVLGNIEVAVASGLDIVIRANLTKENVDHMPQLFHVLEARGLKNRVQVMLKPVVSSSANPCSSSCLSGVGLGSKMVAIYEQAVKNGWVIFPNVDDMQCLGFCVADFPCQFIVDPRGSLYKCGELFTPAEAIGTIGERGELLLDQGKYRPWVEKDPTTLAECRECNILPICMGGCNMKRWWKGIDCCEELKHDLSGFLHLLVLNQQNMESSMVISVQ